MANNIAPADAQAWADSDKVTIDTLDSALEKQIAADVITQLSYVYTGTASWATPESTPTLVKKIIAMLYVSAVYNRQYAHDEDLNPWGERLAEMANNSLQLLISGSVTLPESETGQAPTGTTPVFYPTDASSALEPTRDDPSLGGAKFSMGQLW